LTVLERLPPAAWSRGAKVRGAGKVIERIVLFYTE
jgi:hypothetical protein